MQDAPPERPLAQLALELSASTIGVGCVLVGARSEAYVSDFISVSARAQWPEERVWRAFDKLLDATLEIVPQQ